MVVETLFPEVLYWMYDVLLKVNYFAVVRSENLIRGVFIKQEISLFKLYVEFHIIIFE